MVHAFSDVTFEDLPPIRVIACQVISAEPENDSIHAVQNWLVRHGLSIEGRRSFGFDVPVSPAEARAGLRGYEIGYAVPEPIAPDGGMTERLYGGGLYAVLRVKNAFEAPFESIPAGWKQLMNRLEDQPEFEPVYSLCYEEAVKGETGQDLILYHPVARRA